MRIGQQPLLGALSVAAVVTLSLIFISLFDWPVFRDWVSFLLVCAVPFAFVVGAFWQGEHPRSIARLPQPWKGLAYLALTLAVAAVVAWVHVVTIGGGVVPPTPVVAQCVITSVPITFLLAVVWGGWPFRRIASPLVGGAALLAVAYCVNGLLFRLLVNYDWLRGSPPYVEDIDPHGPVDSWTWLVLVVTTMAAALLLLHVGLWPLSRVARLAGTPWLGVAATAIAVGLSVLVVGVACGPLGVAPPVVLTTVTAPFLFGSIVVLSSLEGSLTARLAQPRGGLASAAIATVVGLALSWLYVAVEPAVSGALAFGPPSYDGQVWLASALLGVTFPFLAFHADYFRLWPLRRDPAPRRD